MELVWRLIEATSFITVVIVCSLQNRKIRTLQAKIDESKRTPARRCPTLDN